MKICVSRRERSSYQQRHTRARSTIWSGQRRRAVLLVARNQRCQVVFVTTEVAPWSKIGGLGDVMAALPAALAARGHRVMTVAPLYEAYSDVRDTGVRLPVRLPHDLAAAAAAEWEAQQAAQQRLQQLEAQREQQGEQVKQQQQLQQQAAVQMAAIREQQLQQRVERAQAAARTQQQLQQQAGDKQAQQQDPLLLQQQAGQQELLTLTPSEQQQQQQAAVASGPNSRPADWRRVVRVYKRQEPPEPRLAQQAAAVYQRAEATAAAAAADAAAADVARGQQQQPQEAAAEPDGSLVSYVAYYMSCSGGVDRVFVDHPLYRAQPGSPAGGAGLAGSIVSSYCHPGQQPGPDLAAAASVLCQAALAAPVLLWGGSSGQQQQQPQQQQSSRGAAAAGRPSSSSSGGVSGAMPLQEHQQQQLQLQRQRRQQRQAAAELLLLMELLQLENREAVQQVILESLGDGSSTSNIAALLAAAAEQRQARLAASLQHPAQLVTGLVQPVLLGAGGSQADPRWPRSDLLREPLVPQQQSRAGGGSSGSSSAAEGPLIFVGNDWPCGVLPHWLDTYRELAAQQQQQEEEEQANPYAERVLQQQQELFQLQQRQQQERYDRHGRGLQALVQSAVDAATPAGSSRNGGSSGCGGAGVGAGGSSAGRSAVAGVFQDYDAVYVNSRHLGSPAASPAELLAELQQEWQAAAGETQQPSSSSSSSSSSSRAGGEASQLQPVAGGAADAAADQVSWSAAAESWLAAAGYEPGSVYNQQLAELVAAAVAGGRVPPEVLPQLTAAQGQLQLLLHQEQLLGEAIERLRAGAASVDAAAAGGFAALPVEARRQVAAAAAGVVHVDTDGVRLAAAGAGAAGSRGEPAHGADRLAQLSVMQQLLGRQLGDAKVAFAIHNYGYQGGFRGRASFDRLGLPQRLLGAFAAPLAAAAAGLGSAAAAAASNVGSQLASLAEALQHTMPGSSGGGSKSNRSGGGKRAGRHKALAEKAAAAVASSGGDDRSRYGLLASVQQLLQQVTGSSSWEDEAAAAAAADSEGLQQLQSAAAAVAGTAPGWEPPAKQQQQQQPPEGSSSADASGGLELQLNWLRAGLVGSDAAVTVSPGYAAELLAGLEPSGAGTRDMPALLAARRLVGIINGLDTAAWDPASDPLLPACARYSTATAATGKAAAKALLQRRLGLVVDPHAPLFVFVGRLTAQKGVDVILATLPQLMGQPSRQTQAAAAAEAAAAAAATEAAAAAGEVSKGRELQEQQPRPEARGKAAAQSGSGTSSTMRASATQPAAAAAGGRTGGARPQPQVVLLGAGELWMEQVLLQLAGRYPGAAAGLPSFNEPAAHLLLAAGDFLLLPSRYEPCGLVALAGLRYGALPIASATGGLADLVTPAVGYSLPAPGPEGDTAAFRRGVSALAAAAAAAAAEYGSAAFMARRAAAMAVDVSWQRPAEAWEQLLLQLGERDGGAAAASSAADVGADAAALRGQ